MQSEQKKFLDWRTRTVLKKEFNYWEYDVKLWETTKHFGVLLPALHLLFPQGWCCRGWGAVCWGTAASGWSSTTTGPAKSLAGTPTAGHNWNPIEEQRYTKIDKWKQQGVIEMKAQSTHRPSRTHQPQYGSLADRHDWQSMWSPHSATGRFSTWKWWASIGNAEKLLIEHYFNKATFICEWVFDIQYGYHDQTIVQVQRYLLLIVKSGPHPPRPRPYWDQRVQRPRQCQDF